MIIFTVSAVVCFFFCFCFSFFLGMVSWVFYFSLSSLDVGFFLFIFYRRRKFGLKFMMHIVF